MQPNLARPQPSRNWLRLFFFGAQAHMELSAIPWWSLQRLGYNLRLILCLAVGQSLWLATEIADGRIAGNAAWSRAQQTIPSDLLLVLMMNLLYFLLPWLEEKVFGGRPEKFRAFTFAFINALSLLFVVFAGLVMLVTLQRQA